MSYYLFYPTMYNDVISSVYNVIPSVLPFCTMSYHLNSNCKRCWTRRLGTTASTIVLSMHPQLHMQGPIVVDRQGGWRMATTTNRAVTYCTCRVLLHTCGDDRFILTDVFNHNDDFYVSIHSSIHSSIIYIYLHTVDRHLVYIDGSIRITEVLTLYYCTYLWVTTDQYHPWTIYSYHHLPLSLSPSS